MLTERILVLGGGGFLGTALFKGLSDHYTNLSCGDIQGSPLKYVRNIKMDLLNDKKLQEKLSEFDVVINLVGQVTNPFSITLDLNTTGMFNLAHSLSEIDTRLVHISSVAVYGSGEDIDESSPLNPETNYATSKASAERILAEILDPEQLVTLRLSNLYGHGQVKGVVAYLLRSVASDRVLEFNNAGNLVRSYLHTEDCVGMIRRLVQTQTPAGTYNLLGPDQLSISQLVRKTEAIFGLKFETHYQDVAPWENIKSLSDAKLHKIIQWSYNWNLEKYLNERGVIREE